MKRLLMMIGAAAVAVLPIATFADAPSWSMAEDTSYSAASTPMTVEVGGYSAAKSSVTSLDAKFRTWLASIGTSLNATKLFGLVISFY